MLVIGGTGFLGYHAILTLLARQWTAPPARLARLQRRRRNADTTCGRISRTKMFRVSVGVVAVLVGLAPRRDAAACSPLFRCDVALCSLADGIALGHAVPAPRDGDIPKIVLDQVLRVPPGRPDFLPGASYQWAFPPYGQTLMLFWRNDRGVSEIFTVGPDGLVDCAGTRQTKRCPGGPGLTTAQVLALNGSSGCFEAAGPAGYDNCGAESCSGGCTLGPGQTRVPWVMLLVATAALLLRRIFAIRAHRRRVAFAPGD